MKLEQMRQAAVLMICDVRVFASGETNDNNNSNNNNNKIKIQQTQSVTRFFMKNHSFYITCKILQIQQYLSSQYMQI